MLFRSRQCSRQKGGTQNTNTLLIFAYCQKLKNHCNKLTDLKWTYLYTAHSNLMDKTLLESQEGVLYFTPPALSEISTLSSAALQLVQNPQTLQLFLSPLYLAPYVPPDVKLVCLFAWLSATCHLLQGESLYHLPTSPMVNLPIPVLCKDNVSTYVHIPTLSPTVVFFSHPSHGLVHCSLCRELKLHSNTILIVYYSHKLDNF